MLITVNLWKSREFYNRLFYVIECWVSPFFQIHNATVYVGRRMAHLSSGKQDKNFLR